MKKIFLLTFVVLTSIFLNAQSAGLNFQGLARDPLGEILASQQLNLKFSIITSTPTGTADFVETRLVNTNELGVFSVVIGDTGSISSSGTYANINWKQFPKYLKVEILSSSSNTYTTLGVTQLQSVPYANFANFANSVDASNINGVVSVSRGGTGLTTTGTNGQFLTSTASGTLTWTSYTGGGIPYSGATQAVNLGAYDLKVNGLTIGKGLGGISSNTAIGSSALFSNTSGTYNTALGASTLQSNTSGLSNTAVGLMSLFSNTTGSQNTGIGYGSLSSNTTGNGNTANGTEALRSNTIGFNNTSTGYASLSLNTVGNNNTANGSSALHASTGSNNTADGAFALFTNTTGTNNTANGFYSLYYNTTGNTNTSTGGNSLGNNTTGTNNSALGYGALLTNITGTNLTGIGRGADVSTDGLTNSTALGYGATVTASNTIQLGNSSITNVKTSGNLTLGSVIYPNTHGTNGQILTTTGSGTLTWTNIANHTIGENFGGGIIFYVYDGGRHGLIASTSDQSTGIRWYGGSLTNTKAKADGLGAGLKNTSIIIANQGAVDGNEFAATLCNQYSVTETVDGITTVYGDWYLPSWYELNLLYINKSVVGGFSNVFYWSSSESFSGLAKAIDFGTGTRTDGAWKYELYRVRAIRAF